MHATMKTIGLGWPGYDAKKVWRGVKLRLFYLCAELLVKVCHLAPQGGDLHHQTLSLLANKQHVLLPRLMGVVL